MKNENSLMKLLKDDIMKCTVTVLYILESKQSIKSYTKMI